MTTIAYRDGVVAADSRETAGDLYLPCQKLFRKRVGKHEVIIAAAGGSYAAMAFYDWFGSGLAPPTALIGLDLDEDFEALILDRGRIYTANHLCRLIECASPRMAIGSGAKAALAAMHCGRSAKEAVRIATLIDPYSGPPIVTMTTPGASSSERAKRRPRPTRGKHG